VTRAPDPTRRLEGRCALVTGGARGVGRGIALALARAGARVVIGSKGGELAEAALADIRAEGGQADAIYGDTSAAKDVERFVAEAEAALGRLDLLVNNAGVLDRTPFLDVTEAQWDRTLDVNLKGYFLVGQAVARRMVAHGVKGTIVNVSSATEGLAAPNLTPYAVSKAGVAMLTRQMALELAPYGIRVNAVCPGLVETDLNRRDLADPAFRDRRLARIPLARFATPDDVAAAVVYLSALDESRHVTGASIYVDGGKSIWNG
jgi:NAD(P)-dependent dehydrogenase (short-subunit alcohol dehydrogenase family)